MKRRARRRSSQPVCCFACKVERVEIKSRVTHRKELPTRLTTHREGLQKWGRGGCGTQQWGNHTGSAHKANHRARCKAAGRRKMNVRRKIWCVWLEHRSVWLRFWWDKKEKDGEWERKNQQTDAYNDSESKRSVEERSTWPTNPKLFFLEWTLWRHMAVAVPVREEGKESGKWWTPV